MNKAKFAVIGVGTWGENHVRCLLQNPYSEVVAVVDKNKDRARTIAKQYGVKKYYTSYLEMLGNPNIDAVSIATPDFLHREPCIAAVDSGKHVLVEKPLATTVEDAEAIADAVKNNNVKFMVDFHNRWNPSCYLAKQAVENGEIGDPIYMYARLNNTKLSPHEFLNWSSKSKVIWFLMVHILDLARWIFEDEAERVYAVSRSTILKKSGINTPDFFSSLVEFQKGAVANLESCWIMPNTFPGVGWGRWHGLGIDFRAELVASKGMVSINLFPSHTIQKYTEERYVNPDIIGTYELYGKWMGFGMEAINHFVDCVVKDKEPLVTVDDGLEITRIICAIEESAEKMIPIKPS